MKRAFNRLAMLVHPDKCASAGAADAFIRLGAAYHVISDGLRRREYDAGRSSGWRT